MEPLFDMTPIRTRPPRGERLVPRRGPGCNDPWPPPGRSADDIAVVATRLLATAGRMQTRLQLIARQHGVDPRLVRFLLLFTERSAPLRITDVADNLGVSHPTAGRVVTRAMEAGLIDEIDFSPIDGREVSVRLTVAGRHATSRCLDALRAGAADLTTELNAAYRGDSGAFGIRWYLKHGPPMDGAGLRRRPKPSESPRRRS